MKSIRRLAGGLAFLAALTLAGGCSGQGGSTPKGDAKGGKSEKSAKQDSETHAPGPHGGTVADWGGGKYHVEFLVDRKKQEATVYLLGEDEKTPAPIKTKDGQLLLTITEPTFQVMLKATPLKGDPSGASSCFVGTHEKFSAEQRFAGTISAEVDGTPYAGDFKEEPKK